MGQISGRYPGGPTRDRPQVDKKAAKGLDDLATVEEIEARRERDTTRIRVRRRRRRMVFGVVVCVVVAGGAGIWIGLRSHRTAEEIAAERRQQAAEEFDLRRTSDRLINELWKMEDLERQVR